MKSWKVLGVVAYALFMDYFIYGLVVPLTPYMPVGELPKSGWRGCTVPTRSASWERRPCLVIWATGSVAAD